MKKLYRWLNLLVAVALTVVCFGYAALTLMNQSADPRPALETMSRSSGYGALLAGVFSLTMLGHAVRFLRAGGND